MPRLATLLDEAEEDVPAYMTFPRERRAKIHSTNLIERLKWAVQRAQYMTLETIAPLSDDANAPTSPPGT